MTKNFNRRRFVRYGLAAGGAPLLRPWAAAAEGAAAPSAAAVMTRPIPSTGEKLPVVGLGTWITFNVGNDVEARDACTDVMRAFFAGGGRLIDSSPMYGSSQPVIGYGLGKLNHPPALFPPPQLSIPPARPPP